MKFKLSQKSASDLFKLGIYQIAGGIIGIIVIIMAMIDNPFYNLIIIALFVLVILSFVFSILCGIFCIKLHHRALQFSLINQLLQLVSIAIGGFSFHYVAGFFLYLGIDLTNNFHFSAEFGTSGFSVYYNPDFDQMTIYINIVALLLIIWIERIKKRTKEEELLQGLL